MALAFVLDGYRRQVGVTLTQDESGVHGAIVGEGDLGAVRRQVARVLSLDLDATAYAAIADDDPVVRRLMSVRPGLRPPLFHSPYEAAAWGVLATRRSAMQAMALRDRIAREHGRVFDVGDSQEAAFPTPDQVLAIGSLAGVADVTLARLRAVAKAATEGRLDVERLIRLGPEQAMLAVQELPGIGPFYGALIVIRATGFADILPDEPRGIDLTARLYGLSSTPARAEYEALAEQWRPFRTWVAVLIRAAGPSLLGQSGH